MNPDWYIVAILVSVAIVLTSIFWIAYGAFKADNMRTSHAEHISRIHADYEMQRRTYGDVPIEKLVGRENT